ncbi:gas vesicle protein GvpO [Actinoallomurus acaciae]|uniref:Gas vesicle protein GvpO n=1 Tax=Actinoallomurus acaciae TaxID=502577 RepID=A0ABV5YS49_9ACTN
MDDRRNDEPRRRVRRPPPPTADRAARLAADHVAEMTGKEPEGIISLKQAEDGGWTIGVEVVETHRIPDTTDVIAVYEAELDSEGELLAYRRVDRYIRCQAGER